MINKFEAIGIGLSIGAMALALFILRADEGLKTVPEIQSAAVIVAEGEDERAALGSALSAATDSAGNINRTIIDDVTTGTGAEGEGGDSVTVNYIGALQNGQQFDNSYTKGAPFTFTVGEGKVIKGWDQGVVGMKEGGQRILVIPSELAYGDAGFGPIPGGATLIFTIELVGIN